MILSGTRLMLKFHNSFARILTQSCKYYVFPIIIFTVTTICHIHMKYDDFIDGNNKVVFSYIFRLINVYVYLIVNCVVLYVLIYRKRCKFNLLQNFKQLKSKFSQLYNVKPKCDICNILSTVGVQFVSHSIIIPIWIINEIIKGNLEGTISLSNALLIFSIKCLIMFEYRIYLSIIKNYYEVMNRSLENCKLKIVRVKQLQEIGKCHQMLIDFSQCVHNLTSLVVLTNIVQLFLALIFNFYPLIGLYIYGDVKWAKVALTSFFITLLTFYNIVCHILTPAKCKSEVDVLCE